MQRRFDIRASGPRSIEGLAIRYGDIASLPWGEERFMAGAFGDISEVDAVLNVQHERSRPLVRTGGGGLSFEDTVGALSFRAELPDTADARDTMTLVRGGVLRGASLEFYPTTESVERRENAPDLITIEAAELVGLAIVDSPAYPASAIEARAAALDSGGCVKARTEGKFRRVWL